MPKPGVRRAAQVGCCGIAGKRAGRGACTLVIGLDDDAFAEVLQGDLHAGDKIVVAECTSGAARAPASGRAGRARRGSELGGDADSTMRETDHRGHRTQAASTASAIPTCTRSTA